MHNLHAICRDENELLPDPTWPQNGYAPLPWGVINSYCSFAPGGSYNTVTGHLRYDCGGLNIPVSFQQLTATETGGQTDFYTNPAGSFLFYTTDNSVTVSTTVPSSYFSVAPPLADIDFSSTNTVTQNFCLSANGTHPDLRISVSSLNAVRPGFPAVFRVTCENIGTESASGTVSFSYPATMADWGTSTPMPASQASGMASWDIGNLMPFGSVSFNIVLTVHAPIDANPVNIGDILDVTATADAGADETPTDNTHTLHANVVGALDPNDKSVSISQLNPSDSDQYLYYAVRFQNTGNFAASNVVIDDTLSGFLDVASLEIVDASHPCHITLNAQRRLQFFFEGIDLPAETTDEPGSHGYVTYRIKPATGLAEGTVISNTASIFFDFNFPVVTNTVSTTLTSLGVSDFAGQAFDIFPNPASQSVTMNLSQPAAVTSVAVFNTLGQKFLSVKPAFVNGMMAIDTGTLASGTYLLQIMSDKGTSTKKLVRL